MENGILAPPVSRRSTYSGAPSLRLHLAARRSRSRRRSRAGLPRTSPRSLAQAPAGPRAARLALYHSVQSLRHRSPAASAGILSALAGRVRGGGSAGLQRCAGRHARLSRSAARLCRIAARPTGGAAADRRRGIHLRENRAHSRRPDRHGDVAIVARPGAFAPVYERRSAHAAIAAVGGNDRADARRSPHAAMSRRRPPHLLDAALAQVAGKIRPDDFWGRPGPQGFKSNAGRRLPSM